MEQAAIRLGLRRRAHPVSLARGAVPLALWAALIVAAWAWGTALNDSGARIVLGAPPLFGRWDLQLEPSILPAIGVAALVVWAAPTLIARLSWPRLLGAVAFGAIVWAVALAASEGMAGITGPLEGPSDYLRAVPLVGSPGEFLSTFTERIDEYPTHVRSHPPGMALILWSLAQVGLGGSTPPAVVVLLVAPSAPGAGLGGDALDPRDSLDRPALGRTRARRRPPLRPRRDALLRARARRSGRDRGRTQVAPGRAAGDRRRGSGRRPARGLGGGLSVGRRLLRDPRAVL